MTIVLPDKVNYLLETLKYSNFEAYVVGGCVRDSILGLRPQDWDITTNATPDEIMQCFENHKLLTAGIKHGTVGVIIDDKVYEITTFRIDGDYTDNRHPETVTFSKNIENDLSRRDFTVNAMAYNQEKGLIDIYGGLEDLKYKAIRCVGDPDKRFKEDALRILRALRFASTYDFTIEIKTSDAIFNNRLLLNKISEERIASEFNKLICGDSAQYILNRYRRVISTFIPEIEVMFNYNQNTLHHNKSLWKHTTSALKRVDNDLILRLTMFFHDVGKPMAHTVDEITGFSHFKGHNKFSVAIAESVLKRLKYSNEIINKVKTLILFHDVRFSDNKRQIKRLLSKIGEENFRDLLKIQKADILAQSTYKREEKIYNLSLAVATFEQIIKDNECLSLKDLAINGHNLIHIGITKGDDIGKTLNYLLMSVIDEKIPNEREILISEAKKFNSKI